MGHIGLLERENAAILNTAILRFAKRTVRAYQQVLKRLDLRCPLFLTQVCLFQMQYDPSYHLLDLS